MSERGVFGWYPSVTKRQRQIFRLSLGSWALDAYDVKIYSFLLPTLIITFGLSAGQAGSLASVTLLFGALGGWFGGVISDRLGRLRALKLSICCVSLPTAAAAFADLFEVLLILKALQGLGFGAAWVAAAVLVTESLPVESRGRALGVVQSGWALGWGAAAIAFGIFFTWYKPEDAWRLAFVVSLVPMVILLFCSASVVEPARSVENVRPGSFFADAAQVFHRDHLRVTLLGGLFGFGAHAGFYGLFTWLPFVLESERGLPVSWISTNLAVLIVAFGAGCLVTGYFSDRYGRRFTVAAFALSSAGCSAVYFFTPTGPLAGLLIGIPIGFFSAGVPASAGALFSELYPKEIRGSGLGFCYNFGRLGAAAVPYLIGALSESYPVELVVGCFAAVAYTLVAVAAALLPATPRFTA